MLHIITQSPHKSSALRECLAVARHDDALLLLGDGVYATTLQDKKLIGYSVYLLDEHAAARGLPAVNWAKYIGYPEMVTLTEQNHPVQTWF